MATTQYNALTTAVLNATRDQLNKQMAEFLTGLQTWNIPPTKTQVVVEKFCVTFGIPAPARGSYRELAPAQLSWAVSQVAQTIAPTPATPAATPPATSVGADGDDVTGLSAAKIAERLGKARGAIESARAAFQNADNEHRAACLDRLDDAFQRGQALNVAATKHADALLAQFEERRDRALLEETDVLVRPLNQLGALLSETEWDVARGRQWRG